MEAKDFLSEVARIAEKVVSSVDSQAPLILLELKHVYRQCPRNSLRILKMNVWHYGLVHILIELLGQNFSSVKGQWVTAAQLGSILSHTLSGLHPEKLKKSANIDASQIEEYYDGVLPTALHSLLVLTNNVSSLRDSPQVFPALLENIAKLCQSHHTLLVPLLQSPYILHMLSCSDSITLKALLSFIKKILTISDSVIPSLSLDVIHNYTDELVQRITTSSELILTLELLSLFLELPNIVGSVAARYQGLTQFLSSLQVDSSTVDIQWMIEILGGTSSKVDQSENLQDNNLNHAAVVIQSHWRGYSARKKVKAINQGIIAFQRLYRKRKAKIQSKKPQLNLIEDMKQESQHIALRMFHEKQFKIIEQLPAKDVDTFLKQLQESSAMKIQKWWRDCNINKKHIKPRKKLTRQTNQQASTHNKESVLLQIDQATRDRFQAEILHYQSHHPIIHKSQTSLQQLHTEVQKQLQVMYLDRTLEKERVRKRKLLLNQLEVDSALLLGAPSLEKAQPNNITQFNVSATGITHMARLAHEGELKSLELPWWKRTNFDSEEIDFDN